MPPLQTAHKMIITSVRAVFEQGIVNEYEGIQAAVSGLCSDRLACNFLMLSDNKVILNIQPPTETALHTPQEIGDNG